MKQNNIRELFNSSFYFLKNSSAGKPTEEKNIEKMKLIRLKLNYSLYKTTLSLWL